MNNVIKFNKIRNVKTPNSAYNGCAAATDFFVPEYSSEFKKDLEAKNPNKSYYECSISTSLDSMTITLAPHGRINIPSGIRVIIGDTNMCLLAVNKSGIAANKGLIIGACLIDADYRGEIHLNLINTGDESIQIKTGDKIVQFMYLPIIRSDYVEITADEFNVAPTTARGTGGFGSSGSF